ncbi:MAG: TetR/AcrR family transcriptional regulator [Pseudomonadota bacterium]
MMTFWRKGYVQTSLDDLVRETGASRASLYKTFGDKKAMFALALDSYASLFEARAAAAMAELPDARAVLHALLTASAERLGADDGPPGCLRCNSTLEIGGVDPDLDAALLHANTRYKEVVAAVLRRGVEEGSLRTSQVKALADFYTATVAGMVTTARAGADLAALQHIVEIAMCAWPPGGRAALQR